MENPIQISEDHQSQGLLNLIQVKQEADEAPHIIYDDKEQWAFLFNEPYGEVDETVPTEIKVEQDAEPYDENPETQPTEIKIEYETESYVEIPETQQLEIKQEPASLDCHWCCFSTEDPLDLIDHDFEKHSRFFQGKLIYKSYKCPSCDFTSVNPPAIRSHYEVHRNGPEVAASSVNETAVNETVPKKKKKRKKQTWDTPVKRRRRPKKGQNAEQGKTKEERRFRRMNYTRKYRASLTPDALAKRRLNDAARMRLKRALETEDDKAERRKKQALHARLKRANETPEQVELRRTTQRNRARVRRSQETEEQREVRKERERLRARERRASLPVDKKELIKEKERTRKRYRRHEAKVVKGDQFINAMEFLSTSLSNSENVYQLGNSSIAFSDSQSYNIVSDEIAKLYPVPTHMLIGHMTEDSPLPKPKKTVSKKTSAKNRSNGKKCGRAAVKKNKETESFQSSNLKNNEDIPENLVKDFTVLSETRGVSNSYVHTEGINVRNDLIVDKELKEPEYNDRLDWRIKPLDKVNEFNGNETTLNEIIQTNKNEKSDINNERIIDYKDKTPGQSEDANISSTCGKDYIELEASIHQPDSEFFNNIKQNKFPKIDKINKLLHRMYVRDSLK